MDQGQPLASMDLKRQELWDLEASLNQNQLPEASSSLASDQDLRVQALTDLVKRATCWNHFFYQLALSPNLKKALDRFQLHEAFLDPGQPGFWGQIPIEQL